MKKLLKVAVVLICLLAFIVSAEWAIQAIWLNAACPYGDNACIQATSDAVTFRMCLALTLFLAFCCALYFTVRKPRRFIR
jgi:flagellar biogenesis protein FliO